MAVRDFKEYFLKIQSQYLEMKEDLKDFEQALKDGHITEDQLEAAKEDVAAIENNYNRLVYVAYLLELPNRNSKKARIKNQTKNIPVALARRNADIVAVYGENKSMLDHLRAELKKLTADKKTEK